MLHIDDRLRRELAQTADDLVPFETRRAVTIPREDAESLIRHYYSVAPRHPDDIGRDLVDKFGADGRDLYELAWEIATEGHHIVFEVDPGRYDIFNYVWRSDDRLLVDIMDDARHDGWRPSPHIASQLERLDQIANSKRDELEAAHQAQIDAQEDGDDEEPELSEQELAEIETKLAAFRQKYGLNPNTVASLAAPAMPLLAGQQALSDIAQPILEGVLAGQHGTPRTGSPALPDVMRTHPLFGPLNEVCAHALGLAQRAPAAFRADAFAEGLAVLELVHSDTCKGIVSQIRGFGCILPDGKLRTAVASLEARVHRATRLDAGWRLNARGEPDPLNADNVAVFLSMVGVESRFNVWRQRVEIRNKSGDWVTLTDAELTRLRGIASREEYRFRPSKEFFRDMLADLARQTSYDPVLDYINGCEWDGVPRLTTWLSAACGVPADAYHQALGRNVIGGIVKRARRPGAKHDVVMILIGNQGCGKSDLTKVLALEPEWHTDSVAFEGRPQDIIPQMHGRLVIELSELDGVHRRDVGYIKRFLSVQSDNYTAKYEALATDQPRRCIFIGTCNLDNPLVDDTGNRRFYPVRIPDGVQINVGWLREHIRLLVAEAAHLDSASETFDIPREVWASAAAVQELARTVSAVEELVLQWFSKPDLPGVAGYYVLSSDVVAALTMARQNANAKVGRVMEKLGYVQARPYVNGVQQRVWVKSKDNTTQGCVRLVPVPPIGGGPVEMRVRREISG